MPAHANELSLEQERMWFLTRLHGATPALHERGGAWLDGPLNTERLRAALRTLTQRHEILRTLFVERNGRPVQAVLPTMAIPLHVVELPAAASQEEHERRAQELAREEVSRPFDLVQGPLWRLCVITLHPARHLLVLCMHHIISDGDPSVGHFWHELFTLLDGGTEAALPALPIQYRDHARRQRERDPQALFERQLAWWREELAGAPSASELPPDRARQATQSFVGGTVERLFPPALEQSLSTLCERTGADLFTVLLTGVQLLLHRYSGQNDVLVGTPLPGRDSPGTGNLIGYFGNPVVLRARFEEDPRVDELLAQSRRRVEQVRANGGVSFKSLVEANSPVRDLSKPPLFQVLFTLRTQRREPLAGRELRLTPVDIELPFVAYDQVVSAEETEQGLFVRIEFNREVFEHRSMSRLLERLEILLTAAARDPSQRISRLPLMSEEERQRTVVAWNQTRTEYPRDACVHTLFEAHAARAPDAIAAVHDGEEVTYGELNRRANRLAHRLRRLGAVPGTRVAICLKRSIHTLVGLLGILKAGGAYVPLDAEYPHERLRLMLEDTEATLLVSTRPLASAMALPIPLIDIDEVLGGEAAGDEAPPPGETTAESLAYILFTSGSTGRPKGVAIPHRGIVRLVVRTNLVEVTPADRVMHASALPFDASTFELWAALLNGARVVVVSQETLLSIHEFPRCVRREGITIMLLTTALFHQMAAAVPEAFRGVRYVLTGGEVLDPRWAYTVLEKGPPGTLINAYGPTENTTVSAFHVIREVPRDATSIPIGKPLSNSTVYVLDQHLMPVPIGVAGELYVGGDGLAHGYVNRPKLTAERFIASPLPEVPGETLYKTGDRVRYLEDGALEFLGRIDQQVKIRGHRIEPGEIESALGMHPSVAEAAVLIREDTPNDRRIVAYTSLIAGAQLTGSDLRDFLGTKLPAYMLPSAFVIMDRLPLTSHGKVDRHALPAPGGERPALEQAYIGPRSEVERIVAAIWCEILHLERIGIHDDFFALGGHSLRATQVTARLRQRLRVEVPLRYFFEHPTIEVVAAFIAQARSQEGTGLELRPAPREVIVPLSFAQESLWFIHQLAPHSSAYNYPAFYRVRGPLNTEVLERALFALVQRHESLRTTFAEVAGRPMQVIASAPPVRLARIDLQGVPAESRAAEAGRLIHEEAQRPFSLHHGPLMRAGILQLAPDDCFFFLTLHHIITDGWSEQILRRELSALYSAFLQRGLPSLPPLSIQYADHAAWQRQMFQSGAMSDDLAWWTETLAGAPTILELPADHPRPPTQTFRGDALSFQVNAATTEALRLLAAGAGVTPTMVLLAAFCAVIHRYTGQEDFLVGTPHANRDHLETEGVIGFFVNTIALRANLRGNPSFRELLVRIRDASLGAYEHATLPFEQLVKTLHPERDLSRNPLVQVMFAPQLDEVEPLKLGAAAIEHVSHHTGRSSFDLSVILNVCAGHIEGSLEYSTELFERETIARLAAHLTRLLVGALEQPDLQLSELPLLSGEERVRCLSEWNDTATPYPMERCVHELFEEQAERTPHAVAVEFGSLHLTYTELNCQANQLARHLRNLGVGPETLVGLCMERSLELAVGLLGILKAGGAYVPLDPSYPRDRIVFMVEDAAAPVILTQAHLADRLPPGSGNVIFVDTGWPEIRKQSAEPLEGAVTSANLAYVIFTSGSTGQPKGVMVEHRSTAALVQAQRRVFGLRPGSRVLQFASISFDAATWDFVMALCSGATLCLPSQRPPAPGPELSRMLRQNRISVATLPPSVMAQQPAEPFPDLEILVVAGDACPAEVVERWAPGRRFFNAYGPTEATVCATIAECRAGGGKPSIGRPIANTRVYILDSHGNPAPIGVPGELYIGGAGVARGYLNRPELTAKRFLKDPFSADPDARVYRTGDLARFRQDGEIEYLGRNDGQVKIRGFRIELEEVEAALRAYPAVRDAAVTVQEAQPGNRRLVAYLVPADGEPLRPAAIREHLKQRLPEYMVPALFMTMKSLPLTPNGKVNRKALPIPDDARPELGHDFVAPRSSVEETLCAIWRDVLGLERIGIDDPFFEVGGDSLLLARVRSEISERLNTNVDMVALFQHPTIRKLTAHLQPALEKPVRVEAVTEPAASPREQTGDIAIIGMVGRFPGARSVEALWDMLSQGREGISSYTPEELELAGLPPQVTRSPGFVPAAGILEDPLSFDASFFGYSPLDARLMDPQQRLFLECAWEALENAGYDPVRFQGAIGVFGGSGMPRYWLEHVAPLDLGRGTATEYRAVTGNPWQFLTTHVAYRLGLRGPALTIQTACSTSLVAVHLACRNLLSRQCDLALAGGISLYSLAEAGYLYEEGGILSPDGHCRPFDAEAHGTVPSSGVALVVLKRLEDALRDGDTIRAVIRGSAINNDGGRKVGYSAPSVDGQSEVITQALAAAGVSADTISYVEAHGTGTLLGDPIEVTALARAYRQGTSRTGYCYLGSVKSNLGHLDAAAGVTGLIKAAIATERALIPGTLHFNRPNPNLDLEHTPFLVTSSAVPWQTADNTPRRAGVSSFGIGGTNAHVVLEEAPQRLPSGPSRPCQLLVLSAKTEGALERASTRLAGHLREHPHVPLADVAFTLQQGRAAMTHRRAVVCGQPDAAASALESRDARSVFSGTARSRPPRLVFMFPGVGNQQVGMGQELHSTERVYREALDECAELFQAELGTDIRLLLFPEEARREDAARQLLRPSLNMAVIFATEYALAKLLLSWGLRPDVVTGHSLGEYAAACISGVLELSDAACLVALRGRICDEMPAAAMLVVPLPEASLTSRLGDELSLAAVNGPGHCVVSGALAAVEALEASLKSEGVPVRRLPVKGAPHSALVEPGLDRMIQRAASMTLGTPRIPFVSNVTGTWMTDTDAKDPAYWARHLRQTTRFAEGLATLLAEPELVLLEVGPGKTLETLALMHPHAGRAQLITTTMPAQGSSRTGLEALLGAVARLWCAGVEVDWAAFSKDERRQRVPLPAYPFDRTVYQLEAHTRSEAPPSRMRAAPKPSQEESRPAPARPGGAPGTVEGTLAGIWCEQLGVEAVRPSDNFFDLGGNSLMAVHFRAQIQERLQVNLAVHALLEHPTFAALLERVQQAHEAARTPVKALAAGEGPSVPTVLERPRLLIPLQEGAPEKAPLFLVQPIGGTVFTYLALARALGADQPVYGLRASGVEPGEPVYSDIPTIAARYVEELRLLQPKGPYVLGGHSSGGVIAYEMALQLLEQGQDVPMIVMIDTVSVEQSRRLRITRPEDVLRLVEGFKTSAPQTYQMFVTALAEDSTFREIVLQTNRALASYEPRACRAQILYVRARERDTVLDAHPETSWLELAEGLFTAHNAPGNHFTVMEPPHVAAVARIVRQVLDALPGPEQRVAPLGGGGNRTRCTVAALGAGA